MGVNFDLPANQSSPTFVDIGLISCTGWQANKSHMLIVMPTYMFNHLISRIKHDEFFPLEKITFICMSYHKTLSLKEKEKHVYWKNSRFTLSYKEKTHPL